VPPELEGLANITNPKTRRPYRIDVQEFSAFASLGGPAALRSVGRAYVSPGAKTSRPGGLSPSSIRRKLSALSSLFDYLCERNAVSGNPVDGVKRPMANGNEGSTQALGDAPARKLLEAPPGDTLKGVRDRAILAPCSITACAARSCAGCGSGTCRAARGVMHFRVRGKRGKTRFVPVHAMAQRLIEEYLAGHGADAAGPVFRPVTNNRKGEVDRALDRSTTTSC
jgi:integrase/recombinase XerD